MRGEHSSSSSSAACSCSNAPASQSVAESSSGTWYAGAPTRVLLFLHKAFREELNELHCLASATATVAVSKRKVAVAELRKRLEFFRSVYIYHCAAEFEVIFFSLNARVENIACTYYLQHRSVDLKFDSIFSCLSNIVEDPGDLLQEFQELVFHVGTLRDSICQHMFKEEKQVFPLFMSHFSYDEQKALVWQFICSLPVMLLEDLFPWLVCFLSLHEQLELKDCIRNILPQDEFTLQEVVISWIKNAAQQPQCDCDEHLTSFVCPREPDNMRDHSKALLLKSSPSSGSHPKEDLHINVQSGPFNGLFLWHGAIRSDFKEILEKLDQIRAMRSSKSSSVFVQINFLTEVLICYSSTLEKIIYPLLEVQDQPSPSSKFFPHKSEVEELQRFLHDANQINLHDPVFLEVLCSKVESLVLLTTEHFSFQETEVFPLLRKNFDHETQQKLLIKIIRTLPLGLLKCLITWFSFHLPKYELKSILNGIEQSGSLDKLFGSLLHEWARIGYTGKTTTENLQDIFSSGVPYMSEDISGIEDPGEKSKHVTAERRSVYSYRRFLPNSLSRSGGTDIVMSSLRASNLVHSVSGSLTVAASFNCPEPRPMDHVCYFHRAIKKDLEALILEASKLRKNLDLLMEFSQHFSLVRSLYELHSEMEDKVAFPALEANPNARNLTESYTIDHELEAECFTRVSGILDEMSELYDTISRSNVNPVNLSLMKYHQLCLQLEDSCKSLQQTLDDHIHREETELWPLFREFFSIEEQEKILGYMLGRTRAEILQEMIVWLMAYLTLEEQQAMLNFWRNATRYTKFDEWLGEWWKNINEYDLGEAEESTISPRSAVDYMETVSKYLCRGVSQDQKKSSSDERIKLLHDDTKTSNMTKKMKSLDMENQKHVSLGLLADKREKRRKEQTLSDVEQNQLSILVPNLDQQTKHLVVNQADLEAALRRVSQDSSLDLEEKSRVMQNLMTRHWVAAQQLPDSDAVIACQSEKLPGQFPSYRDNRGSVFGCKHYKQNCKLFATCCNRFFTCRRCHDEEVSDHVMERKSITQMMCMKCLEVQPIGRTCSTPSCNNYSMAKYYCKICKLFDDEREIYHCPYCNLCRVGKGLGIDYFHCMKCNACMSPLLELHTCIENCIEAKCPICQEDMFTSSNPVKSLLCGHVMHSVCFEEYTCSSYTCPVCSKSLGNMQVYFQMLDALLAEEKMPDEYRDQTQAILCNDCEKKGCAPFHWLYHKCQYCGSYNTRLL